MKNQRRRRAKQIRVRGGVRNPRGYRTRWDAFIRILSADTRRQPL